MWILLLFIFAIIINYYPDWSRQRAIKRWRYALALDKHGATHHQLFASINGYRLSQQARRHRDAMEYVYGEIEFVSFIALLSLTNPDKNTIFYDLGSGTGKAVFACAMVFPIKKSCGIELFSELHHAALHQREQLRRHPDYLAISNNIHLIHADFLDADFSDATHVFINATGFFGETWTALNQKLETLPPYSIIITTSKKLISRAIPVVKITRVQMSWGRVNAYIHRVQAP